MQCIYYLLCLLIVEALAESQVQPEAFAQSSKGKVKKGPPPPTIGFDSRESAGVNLIDGHRDAASSSQPSRMCATRSMQDDKLKDTNILMIKFGALSKPCKVHTGDPVICSNDQCAAILNYHSKITKETGVEGNVRFCVHALQ